jgi:glycyl-tRNA synthetase
MFINFERAEQTQRKKPPFGIAQIGKSFRNEITPGNFVFRTREFEQMEMEFFVAARGGPAVVRVLAQRALPVVLDLGMPIRRSCACATTTPMSSATTRRAPRTWSSSSRGAGSELEGIANRGDYDLTAHATRSGETARLLRPGHQLALHPARDRAGGRGHPHDDGVPNGRL